VDNVAELIASHIIDVPDFPKPGIVFKDLSPLFADGLAFRQTIDVIADHPGGFDLVAGVEARGFLLAAGVAYASGVGLVPVRKAGKLPRATYAETYELEYGAATIEIHTDSFLPGLRVLIVDDVLATGGTAAATVALVERSGASVSGVTFLLELGFLDGRSRLAGQAVRTLLSV
jgi:adenine phosphoribosyltransferase